MWFGSIVLLTAEPFSIYLQFLESLMALGRPRQSVTFRIEEDREARFSGIADNLSICEERQHMNHKCENNVCFHIYLHL